ncbi:hypothetical protein VTL71DRAFT_7967 [Oculimacula yallundae]|uniref:Uncharacterized protein n=1 Tax=Oculimacula yallundae TaxID=86028 RepID=A0ABR4CW91_9HELO
MSRRGPAALKASESERSFRDVKVHPPPSKAETDYGDFTIPSETPAPALDYDTDYGDDTLPAETPARETGRVFGGKGLYSMEEEEVSGAIDDGSHSQIEISSEVSTTWAREYNARNEALKGYPDLSSLN